MGIRAYTLSPADSAQVVGPGVVITLRQCTDAQMHRCTDGQMHRCTDAQMHRCTDGQRRGSTPARRSPPVAVPSSAALEP
eukprot:CAMPEP_0173182002 /NCGR_PEP_ID=MMETSP1141-20130122/7593_1 /TAXON_ID=483371 /ORGANISM="non described non described, Strain CCMP2298" /LENGTH=79 /DNA_ID=CAMNT_0014105043 /DNA_START=318 /DNA_END=553 /DNA_ORIENTATION=+